MSMLRSSLSLACALALVTAAVGCDSGSPMGGDEPDAGDDAGAPPDLMPTYPAPFPAPPQVETQGGAVLAAPTIVPVFFSNDDAPTKTKLKDFYARIGATNYWSAVTSEYGVEAATSAAPIELKVAAADALADTDIEAWLLAKLDGGDPAFANFDENTLFAINYPSSTSIAIVGANKTSQSCVDFGGYHGEVQTDARHGNMLVAFAVVPRCDTFGALKGIDATTAAASHELIEAATDPYPKSDPAYSAPDAHHIYWAFALGGGEVGDMCAQEASSFAKLPELPYTVQRSWSNKAAAAGHDPCVPAAAGTIYFNTVPELNDELSVGPYLMLGVSIPVGTSKVVPLDLFSDADTGAVWSVKVQDAASLMGQPRSLNFALDKASGKNGDRIQLTISSVKAGQYGAAAFLITSKLPSRSTTWLGIVGQQ